MSWGQNQEPAVIDGQWAPDATAPAPVVLDDPTDVLIAEFVRLRIAYPNSNPQEIAKHVFRQQRNPGRYMQAAQEWALDFEINERIRIGLINGREQISAADVLSKEQRIVQLQELAQNDRVEAKERIAAYKLIAEMQGEIVKVTDATKRKGPATIKLNIVRQDGPPNDAV